MIARTLLAAGVAMPVAYFASQIAAMLLNPGFDIAAQQPSEFGCCGANAPFRRCWIARGVST